ncbi:TPA: zinc-ribbon domain-containing protein [archaeon]|nr:zinc-ribbon domain-containing protein [Candidatus Naiadarchaeales archaeon SRR2090153.bin461]
MENILSKFKNPFATNKQRCPECGADIGKSARLCPECGHNFMVEEEPRPTAVKFNYSMEGCCSVILVLLIIVAAFFLVFPEFRRILFVLAAILAVFGVAVVLFFAHAFVKLRKLFRF